LTLFSERGLPLYGFVSGSVSSKGRAAFRSRPSSPRVIRMPVLTFTFYPNPELPMRNALARNDLYLLIGNKYKFAVLIFILSRWGQESPPCLPRPPFLPLHFLELATSRSPIRSCRLLCRTDFRVSVFAFWFPLATRHSPLSAIPFRIRTFAESASNSCRMSSFKTLDLKSFRMRTYEKPLGGGHR